MTRSGVGLALAAVVLAGCTTGGGTGAAGGVAAGTTTSAGTGSRPTTSGTALPWGPTVAELAAARAEVATWDDARLAGQVIVGRFHGSAPAAAAAQVRRLHLAGLCLTGANIVDAQQVRAMTSAVHAAVRADGRDLPAVIGVDQEGGTVAHLGTLAASYPAFMTAGAVVAGARRRGQAAAGEAVVAEATRALGLELRAAGFTWDFAPVADVTMGAADPTIGTRSPSGDPDVASAATVAAVRGFTAAGLVSTAKHFPGHGSVTSDSHRALPVQRASLAELADRDLMPFTAAVRAGAPAVMVAHVAVPAAEPDAAVRPASLSAGVYGLLRGQVGFDGVAITDSLGMGAVRAGGDPGVRALAAGADLLLMPADTSATHAAVMAALAAGTLPRPRVAQAATRVVALQRWQARRAAQVTVPDDARRRAETASAALSAAGVTQVTGRCPLTAVTAVRIVGGSAPDRQRFTAAARSAGLRLGSGPTVSLVGSTPARADIVVALDRPTVLASSHATIAGFAIYGHTEGAFAALAQVLSGRLRPSGALPVEVAGVAEADSCAGT